MINFKAIGRRIKEERIKNDLTQEKLAEHLNVSVEYMSRIENGNCRASYSLIENLSKIFGVDEAELLFGKSDDYNSGREVIEKASRLSDAQRDVIFRLIDLFSDTE